MVQVRTFSPGSIEVALDVSLKLSELFSWKDVENAKSILELLGLTSAGGGVLELWRRLRGHRAKEESAPEHDDSERCFRHQLLLPRPYLVLTKPLRLDIQCQRAASVKIGWKYLDD